LQKCSSSKYASIDGVGFSISRHTFKLAAMTSFDAEKCRHLLSAHSASARRICSSVRQFLIYSAFVLADSAAELSVKNMKAFNEEFILVSQRLGRLTLSLVLTVQCLVFVSGVLMHAASVSRSSFFLLAGVNSSPDDDVRFVVLAAASSRSDADHCQSVDTPPVGKRYTQQCTS